MKILDYQREIIELLPPNVILETYGSYCPVCFSNHIKPGSKTFAPFCAECGWKGNMEDLLTENQIGEVKNIRRTELIDKMLNI